MRWSFSVRLLVERLPLASRAGARSRAGSTFVSHTRATSSRETLPCASPAWSCDSAALCTDAAIAASSVFVASRSESTTAARLIRLLVEPVATRSTSAAVEPIIHSRSRELHGALPSAAAAAADVVAADTSNARRERVTDAV